MASLGLVTLVATPLIGVCLTSTSCSSSEQYVDIVSLNDFHGSLGQVVGGNTSDRAPVIEQVADKYQTIVDEDYRNNGVSGNTDFILDGDIAQGSALSNLSSPSGSSTYTLLKDVFHPTYSSIGNHEFDWGQGFLDPAQTVAGGDTFAHMGGLEFLACNIFTGNEGAYTTPTWVRPYAIKNYNGFKVGFVGYTTYETYTTTTTSLLTGLTFADGTNDTEAKFPDPDGGTSLVTGTQVLQDTINDCWNDPEQPDAVILLAHAGDTYNASTGKYSGEITDVIHNIDHVSACISGHTHLKYSLYLKDKDGKNVPTGQGGRYGNALLQTRIYYKKSDYHNIHVDTFYREINNELTEDQLVNKNTDIVQTAKSEYWEIYNQMSHLLTSARVEVKPNETTGRDISRINSDDHTTPEGLLYSSAVYELLSSDVFDNTGTFSEFANLKSDIQNVKDTWNSFNGVDISILNSGCVRNDLVATGTRSTANDSWNTTNLYDAVPFDNKTYLCRIKVSHINDYFTQFYQQDGQKHQCLDPLASSKYKLGFDGTNLTDSNNFYLCDTNGNKVNPDNFVFMACSDFFFLNGDGASWEQDVIDDGETWYIPSVNVTVDGINFDVFADARDSLIEMAYIYNVLNLGTTTGAFPTLDLSSTTSDQYHWCYNFNDYYCQVS